MKTFECPICNADLTQEYLCTKCFRSFAEEVKSNYDLEELTFNQMEQQDKTDNACIELIAEFAPYHTHNIEHLDLIRKALVQVLCSYYGKTEYDIYPWMLQPKVSNSGGENGK